MSFKDAMPPWIYVFQERTEECNLSKLELDQKLIACKEIKRGDELNCSLLLIKIIHQLEMCLKTLIRK